MKRYMEHIIASADRRVSDFMAKQITDENSRIYGGLEQDIIDVKPTVYMVGTSAAVYANAGSRFYHSRELAAAMELALDFIRRYQREDGSFDFPSCNFCSAPDTAFCFKRLLAAYRLLGSHQDGEIINRLREKLLYIMKEALGGIRDGGFHTPNHRWAITTALIQGAELFPGEEWADSLRARAAEYLAEGIDGNEDGEYAERSTGNYNMVVNQALINLYETTRESSYLEYVDRNLQMMLTYIDPDDTIFTQNSTRQDRGLARYADNYFHQYLYMAVYSGREEFAAAAHKLIQDNLRRGDLAPDCLHSIMLWPGLAEYELKSYGFPASYRKYYRDSGVLRVKNKEYTYSILKGNRNFCYIKFGGLQFALRIGESYCETRNFLPQEICSSEQGCVLISRVKGWYYQPFEEKPADSDWWKMDHSRRRLLESSELITTVAIREQEKGLEIKVLTEGLDRLPLRVELWTAPGCRMEGSSFSLTPQAGQALLLKAGSVMVEGSGQRVKIGSGVGTHRFAGHYSETDQEMDCCIRMNDYTPGEISFSLEKLPEGKESISV